MNLANFAGPLELFEEPIIFQDGTASNHGKIEEGASVLFALLEKRNAESIKTSTKVEQYIERQKSPQREIVQRLRSLILKTCPDLEEEFKMGVPWYKGKFYLVALKDHVNLGFSVKGLSENELALFEGKGQMMRHIKFLSLDDIDEPRIEKLLKLVNEKVEEC